MSAPYEAKDDGYQFLEERRGPRAIWTAGRAPPPALCSSVRSSHSYHHSLDSLRSHYSFSSYQPHRRRLLSRAPPPPPFGALPPHLAAFAVLNTRLFTSTAHLDATRMPHNLDLSEAAALPLPLLSPTTTAPASPSPTAEPSLLRPLDLITPNRSLRTLTRDEIAFLVSQGHILLIHCGLVVRMNGFLAAWVPFASSRDSGVRALYLPGGSFEGFWVHLGCASVWEQMGCMGVMGGARSWSTGPVHRSELGADPLFPPHVDILEEISLSCTTSGAMPQTRLRPTTLSLPSPR